MEILYEPKGRRSFLKSSGSLSLGAWALAQNSPLSAEAGENLSFNYPSSILNALREELDIPLYTLQGKLPTDIAGHAFIVSALPQGDGSPVTNGDGMLYRCDFGSGPSGVQLKTRIAKTPCYYADQATKGTALGFKNSGILRRSDRLGVRNQVNTAFTCMGSRLLVTFDGGRPYEVDTETLELVTPVGKTSEWTTVVSPPASNLLKLVFMPYLSGAHPFYDDYTGELFLANYQPAVPLLPSKTFLLRWDGEGELEKFKVQVQGKDVKIAQSMHQLAATRDHIILVDTAFRIELEQIIFTESLQRELWDTTLYLIRRADLKKGQTTVEARKVLIPREIAHFVADYDDSSGQIILHLTHSAAWATSEWLRKSDKEVHSGQAMRKDLQGMLVMASDMTPMARYALDAATGEIKEATLLYDEQLTWSVNLYTHQGSTVDRFENMYWTSVGFHPELLPKRIYDLETSYKYRKVPTKDLPFAEAKPASLFRVNARQLDKQNLDAYIFPRGRVVSSPIFVPAAGSKSSDGGYVVVSVVSDDKSLVRSSGDELWIFDARSLADGPVCRLGHPLLSFGYSLHTAWLPEVQARTAGYKISPREDYSLALASQRRDVVELFEKSVFPMFD